MTFKQLTTRRSPFRGADSKWLIVHCCYHKTATHWFSNIFKQLRSHWGLRYDVLQRDGLFPDTEILLDWQSEHDPTQLPPFRGSHIIRDPRDIVVSAYFYHLWTDESWAHDPRPDLGGMSYQQYLKTLGEEEGMLAEIDQRKRAAQFERMAAWDYQNPNFLELRYEQLVLDVDGQFRELFEFYGLHPEAVESAVKIATQCSFTPLTNRNLGQVQEQCVLRSGRVGQWQEHFTDRVKQHFKLVAGDVLVRLGYETSDNW